MKINQIVDEQMKEFDEKFVLDLTEVFFGKREKLREQGWEVGDNGSKILKQSLTPDQVKSFIHSYTRKLIESLAEEIIGVVPVKEIAEFQRLKVKEIINQISK